MWRKISSALLFLILCAFCTHAQTTVVSGTVTDTGAQVWANGTYQIQLVSATPGLGGIYTLANGTIVPNQNQTGTLSGTGTYSVTLTQNTAIISPGGTLWEFTFCPQVTANCFTEFATAVGATQTTNASPPAIVIKVPTTPTTITPVTAYSDSEISGGWIGFSYFNVTSLLQRQCTALPCVNNFSSIGGGGGTGSLTNSASPVMGFYLSPACPISNTGQCFFTSANTQQANDCSWTSGSNSIICASAHFVPGDVNKRIMGWATCAADPPLAITNNATALALVNSGVGLRQMSIVSYVSSTSITVNFNADNTASGNTHCLVWGTPDDSGAAALDTAVQTVSQCPKLFLAAGYYWFNSPHFFIQPLACNNLGTIFNGAAANTVYAAGYEIEGRGTGNTVIFIPNDFGVEVAGDCSHGVTNQSCFVRTLNGRWHDFQITGGANPFGTANTNNLIEVDGPGSVDNITCTNFGFAQTNNTGMFVQFWDRWYQVNNSGCGYIATATTSSNSNPTQLIIYKYRAENNAVGLLHQNNGSVYCQDCGFLGSNSGLVSAGVIQNTGGGLIDFYGGFNQIGILSNPTGVVGYLASTTAGANFVSEGTGFSGGASSNFTSIKCTVACTNQLFETTLSASGTGHTIIDVAGSVLGDYGGNTFYNGGAGPSLNGIVDGSPSITFSPLVTGNVVISACGTSTASLFSGTALKGQFTITFAGAPGTTCTATVTFPLAFLAVPLCTWVNQGGTNTLATTITQTAATKTTTAATFSGPTFTNGNTIIVQYTCSNP